VWLPSSQFRPGDDRTCFDREITRVSVPPLLAGLGEIHLVRAVQGPL
jgi:hypothetical protein